MRGPSMALHWKDPVVFWILILLISLSGCISVPPHELKPASIDQFPAFRIADGPDIDPASERDAVADVGVLTLDENMKRILDESIVEIKSPMRRSEALLDLIHSNGLFKETNDRYRTKTARETFASGAGNCLSFSSALVAMARYVGLDAYFQDVATPPNWDKQGELLFLNRHVSVSLHVNRHKEYEIDFHPGHRVHRNPNHRLSQRISDRRAIAQYYNNIGSEHLANGNVPDGFRYFIKALTLDPELSYVWSNLGSAYNHNGQEDAAEKAYKQAIAVNRDEFTAMSNLARLYRKLGRTEESAFYREKVRAFRNRNPYYHLAMGEQAFDEDRYEESIKHLKRAIKRKSDEPHFYLVLAHAYLKLGNMRDARKSLSKAKAYEPDSSDLQLYYEKWKALSEAPNFGVLR